MLAGAGLIVVQIGLLDRFLDHHPHTVIVFGCHQPVPPLSPPEIYFAHSGIGGVLNSIFHALGVHRPKLLVNRRLRYLQAVWCPGFGLKLVDYHVFAGEYLAPTSQGSIEPGWQRVFKVTLGHRGVPDSLINRYAELIRRGVAHRYADPIIAAANYHLVFGVEFFNKLKFFNQPISIKVLTFSKNLHEELIFQLIAVETRMIFIALNNSRYVLIELGFPLRFRGRDICPLWLMALRPAWLAQANGQRYLSVVLLGHLKLPIEARKIINSGSWLDMLPIAYKTDFFDAEIRKDCFQGIFRRKIETLSVIGDKSGAYNKGFVVVLLFVPQSN